MLYSLAMSEIEYKTVQVRIEDHQRLEKIKRVWEKREQRVVHFREIICKGMDCLEEKDRAAKAS